MVKQPVKRQMTISLADQWLGNKLGVPGLNGFIAELDMWGYL